MTYMCIYTHVNNNNNKFKKIEAKEGSLELYF